MKYDITTRELTPQSALVVRRRVKPAEIAQALGEMFGQVYVHAQRTGAPLAGPPFARYLDCPPGLWSIEAGMPVLAVSPNSQNVEVVAETLPGGLAAFTIHTGPYDKLPEAHVAIQRWMEAEGRVAAGPPWESYITDPANHPDPKDWKTEIFLPLAS